MGGVDTFEFSNLIGVLERIAVANEELIALAKSERDFGDELAAQPGPPFCPHCSRVDPLVTTHSEGEGRLSDFVLVMKCRCGETFYGMAEGWQVAPDVDAAIDMREARRAGSNEQSS